MKRAILISLLFVLPISIWGRQTCNFEDIAEQVVTKNGERFSGYISYQIAGDKMEFVPVFSLMVDTIIGKTEQNFIPEERLNKEWAYLIEEGEIEQDFENGKKGLFLYSFKTKKGDVENVRILEKNGKAVHYYSIDKTPISISLDDIKEIFYKYDANNESALLDVIELFNDTEEIVGYIEKKVIGQSITIKIENSNISETYSLKDIKSFKKRRKNSELSIIQQAKWIETVETKKGHAYEGVIVSTNYSDNDNETIMLIDNGNSQDIVLMKDVISISKRKNNNYSAVKSAKTHDFTDSDILFNGEIMEKCQSRKFNTYLSVKENKGKKNTLEVETDNEGYAVIEVQRKNGSNMKDIVAYELKKDTDKYQINYADFIDASISPTMIDNNDAIIDRFELPIGKYFFYFKDNNEGYIITITEKE